MQYPGKPKQTTMHTFWNERYNQETYVYGTEPNQFIAHTLADLAPGRILFAGEGEGRNAVYAAKMGWKVTAVDYSEEGRKKAQALAEKEGVTIDYETADLAHWQPKEALFDALAMAFVHLPPDIRSGVHHKMTQWLRPGGFLIMEAFEKGQLSYGTGGPKNKDMLYSVAELKHDFRALETLLMKETLTHLNEGPYHQGQAQVIQMLARQPIP